MGVIQAVQRVVGTVFLVSSFLALAGCSGGGGQNGVVEGAVTIDGTPANSGEVIFANDKGQIAGQIQPDGNYRAVGVPLGSVTVTVQSAKKPPMGGTPEVKDMGKGGGGVANPIPIPLKYAVKETSGLSTTVKAGTNKYPIPLTAK